jgi:hypothetical protein
MAKPYFSEQLSEHDRLISRPSNPLPTPLDPASPEARGAPADPKPEPWGGQGTDPHAGDIGYTA